MQAFAVVEIQILANRNTGLGDAVVGPQIDLFLFDRTPDPPDKDVVAPGVLTIHADADCVFQQQASERGAGLAFRSRHTNVPKR